VRENGFLKLTNLTTAVASSGNAPLQAKTVLVGKGDPGYKLTSGMVSFPSLVHFFQRKYERLPFTP
jgi:hypothetical protein